MCWILLTDNVKIFTAYVILGQVSFININIKDIKNLYKQNSLNVGGRSFRLHLFDIQ